MKKKVIEGYVSFFMKNKKLFEFVESDGWCEKILWMTAPIFKGGCDYDKKIRITVEEIK